ncbi:lipoprotein LpqH [Mycolicibacterium goodii]|uniref:lipoprotein LpqH n=1 Tax=Mycolicibacterium goodii TaxID=134601 RepID=UPI001F04EE2C|nr:lipoprotein LpqH [Mycolicibacterium goodii]ULN47360.1 lipoprotein LpqH [Mycolicibacterium goodii]
MELVVNGLAAAAACAVVLAGVAACSSHDSSDSGQRSATESEGPVATPVEAGQGKVALGGSELGPVTAIGCETEHGLTTIGIESDVRTTVTLTEGEAPNVESVNIGDVWSEGPSVVYMAGLSGAPVVASRDGDSYTVTGIGMGADAADPSVPADTPFDIAVTCP